MKHRLFTFASAMSLILCVATVALCVRSYWVEDTVGWCSGRIELGPKKYRGTWRGLLSSSGRLSIGHDIRNAFKPVLLPQVPRGWWHESRSSPESYHRLPHSIWGRLGFCRTQWTDTDSYIFSLEQVNYWCPHWALALPLALSPAWWAIQYVRHRNRARAAICQTCGYDLRATPDLCPECGTPVAKVPTTTRLL
jgi:hypothetical protein